MYLNRIFIRVPLQSNALQCYNYSVSCIKERETMTAKEAIQKLEAMKQYSAAKDLAVLDYAIRAIKENEKAKA